MSGLTTEQREELRGQLAALREDLRALLASSREGARPVDLDEPIGRVSRMDAIQQQSMVQANRRAMEQRLRRVEAALRRCEEGEYGDCLDCGEDIDAARLKVQPETPFCIRCQSRREARR